MDLVSVERKKAQQDVQNFTQVLVIKTAFAFSCLICVGVAKHTHKYTFKDEHINKKWKYEYLADNI